MTENDPLANRVSEIWSKFRPAILERLVVLDEAATELGSGQLDAGRRQLALREAHKLAGSVGTFGFATGSRLAREIEDLLEGVAPLGTADAVRMEGLLRELRNDLERPL